MSYHVSVWCVRPLTDATLQELGAWQHHGEARSISGKGWILNAGPSSRVLPEDIPEEIMATLPGIEHVAHLSLEPIDAPKAGAALLRKVAAAIAKAGHGVIFDPQQDTLQLASGARRYVSAKSTVDRVSQLRLSWWFDHPRLLERASIVRVLDILSNHLPEALPRRYGTRQPPQHELEKTGREHLVDFLATHLTKTVVWYGHPPVRNIFTSLRAESGWLGPGGKSKYCCNCVSLQLDTDALEQPGWQVALERVWRRLSLELEPFYSEVRTLRGYQRYGSRLAVDGDTELSPTSSWSWKGIPPRLGHAVALGPRYRELWPAFAQHAEVSGDLAFVATPDWRTRADAADLVGGVPRELALPFMPHMITLPGGGRTASYPEEYPALFPFGARPT
jgi:hypothetical protein